MVMAIDAEKMAPRLRQIVMIDGTQCFSKVSIWPHIKSIRNLLQSVLGFYSKTSVRFLFKIKFSIEWYMNQSYSQVHYLQNIDNTFIPKYHNRAYVAEYQSKAKVRPMKLKLIEVTANSDHYNYWKFHVKLPLLSNRAEMTLKRPPSFELCTK